MIKFQSCVVGDREPVLEDRSLLPYCEATVMEVQRISCVAVASLSHTPMEDVDIKGYKITKGKRAPIRKLLLVNCTYYKTK